MNKFARIFEDSYGSRFLGSILSRAGIISSNALCVYLIAQLVSDYDLGRYFALYSVALITSTLLLLGGERILVREVASGLRDEFEVAQLCLRYLSTSFYLWAFITAAAYFFTELNDFLFSIDFIESIFEFFLLAFWILFWSMQRLMAETVRGIFMVSRANLVQGLLSAIITATFLLGALALDVTISLETVLLVHMLTSLFSLAVGWYFVFSRNSKLNLDTVSKSLAGLSLNFLWESRIVYAISMIDVFIANVDVLIVLSLLGPESAAVYGVITRLASLLFTPLIALNNAFSPTYSRLYATDDLLTLSLLSRTSTSIAGGGCLPLLLCYVFFGDLIISWFLTSNSDGNTSALLIFSFTRFFLVMLGNAGSILIMSKLEIVALFSQILSIIFVFLGVLLFPMETLVDLVKVFSVSILIGAVYSNFILWQRLGVLCHSGVSKRGWALMFSRS